MSEPGRGPGSESDDPTRVSRLQDVFSAARSAATGADEHAEVSVGRELGAFRLLRPLGRGGMGTVPPAFLEVSFELTEVRVRTVRVVLDTTVSASWNEIDAVELVGPERRAWATSARASSYYSD